MAGFSARFEPKQPLSRDRSLPERRSKALPELIEFFELLGPANARSGTAVPLQERARLQSLTRIGWKAESAHRISSG